MQLNQHEIKFEKKVMRHRKLRLAVSYIEKSE